MTEQPEHGSAAAGRRAPTSNASTAIACPVCRVEDCPAFYRHGDIDLHTCASCGTVFMHPLPADEELESFYDDSYDGASTGYFAKVKKKMRRSRGRARYLSRYVSGGSFLDVGCNGGFMVEAARERGFAACGVDIDSVSIDYARRHYPNNRYFHGTVESLASGEARFDLAYCSEVIEHVSNVHRFVAAIAGLLKPGGILFITTPDISHWRRPRELTSWDGFNPPAHCIYFNPNSLGLLLEQHGLRILRRRPAFKPGIKLICKRC